MAGEVPSSFIPRETLAKTIETPVRRSSGIFTPIALVILALSLVFFAGAYAYKLSLYNDINSDCPSSESGATVGCGLSASVDKERRALSTDRLNRYKRLDAKMKIAQKVVAQHNALVPLFEILASSTLRTVRFSSFEYTPTGVNLAGTAESYDDIAVQSRKLGELSTIKSFIFSDLDLNDKGTVGFKLIINLDPSLTSYKTLVTGEVPLSSEFNQ
jgi:hypothetical protein